MRPEPLRPEALRPEPLHREGGLGEELDAALDAWVETTRARHVPPLTTRELHSGLRALSARYVEGREGGRKVFQGAGKRAAFAIGFAPLHFLTVWHAVRAARVDLAGIASVLDFGCGSAPLAAAVARAAPGRPRIAGFDPSGWALGEARHTLTAFGLEGRLRRGRLPDALPAGAPGELWGFGWVVNELAEPAREATLARIQAGLERGASLLLLEPLSGAVSPWWEDWVSALAPHGVVPEELRLRPRLPPRIAEMDRATGLRHQEIGARLLHGPPR